MQQPKPETVTLDDILITEELSTRSPRPPNWQAEAQAMQRLARQMARDSESLMQTLVDTALELCQAGTAGVSLLKTTPDGEEVFCWNALAGTLAHHVGGSTFRNFSPCGVCLERGSPVLFSHPDRYFTYFQAANTPIVEGLVLPLMSDSHTLGTIWILSHDEQRHFDAEDVRVMTSLADFTAAALLLNQRQTHQLLAKNAQLEAEAVECKPSEDDRKLAKAAIAADFKDTQLLHELSTRLVTESNIQALYQEIMEAAIALTHADAGTVQILDEATQELLLLATQGLERDLTDRFDRVNASSNTSCGRALITGERTFIDFDVHQSEDPDGSMRIHIEAGYLSAQSTPLIARSGKAIGMVSTHWRNHHRPSDLELRFLDLLARQAADLIEQRQAEAALRESEEHFRAFVNTSSDIVYRMSADWSVMHHLEGKQFIASTTNPKRNWLEEYIPEDEQPQVWAAIESAIQTKSNFELEHRVFREDGTSGWTFSRAIPLLNEQGEIIEWFGAASDITDRKQAEAALRDSEEKYRTLFNSIDEGFCIFELIEDEEGNAVDWIYLEANPAFEQQTGFINPIGKRISELQPDLERLWFERFACIARTGQPVRFVQYTEAMGIWYDVYAVRVGGAGDNRVSLLFTDITDRKRREANLAFLADLMNDFAPLATAEEIMEMAGTRLAEHLNLSRYLFVEINPEAGDCTYLLPSHPPGQLEIGGSYILADYHTEEENRLLSAGHSMVVNDVRDGTRSPEQIAAFEAFDIASIVNTPYLSNGRWVFDLGVTRSQPSVWREDEIELLREISARLWLRIERARAEADLRESEAKYRSLFNSIDEGFCLFEMMYDETGAMVDYRFLEVNPVFERQTGLKNVVGKLGSEIAPNTESYWLETYDAVVKTGNPQRIENYNQATDRWYSAYASRIGGVGSRQVCTVFSDITELKRNEQRQAYLLQLSDTLRSLSDAVEIYAAVTRIAMNFFGADRCYYCQIIDGNAIIRRDASREGLPSVAGVYSLSDFLIFKAVIDAGHPLVVEDAHTTDILDEALRQLCCEMQVISFLNVPVIKKGEPAGVLCITQITPRNWTDLETELAQETAERIWAAVERARSEAALRESEIQRLREQSAREEERQRAEALAELDRAKTLFFSNVSHEFRTPLTLSLAPLQDALSDRIHPLNPIHRDRLELAHRNNLRLLKLVNTLLDFSRIEAGRMEAVYEPTDLAMFTTELASVFRSAIERAGLRLTVDCPPLPEPVYVDREMWEKIVLNLLSNAFKFTYEGEITVSLTTVYTQLAESSKILGNASPSPQITSESMDLGGFKTSSDYSHVMLEIRDTGTGIAPEHLPHLVERFYQVRGTQARTHEGSGIGLALVHELVRLQGGTINLNSTVGEGTCFAIAIPFGTEHLPHERIQATRTQTSTALSATSYAEEAERWLPLQNPAFSPPSPPIRGETGVQSPPKIPPMLGVTGAGDLGGEKVLRLHNPARILVVDDNADMREYLTRILSEHVRVEAVADGATALAVAQERVPDLILSDVMMPELNGFQLLQALRADPRTREIPIVLLSARAGEEAIVEGLEAGADDYLIKPFSAQELVSRVNAHLQMTQLRTEALQEAKTNIRRRDEMLSIVSHELNTPLVAILGWTRLLRTNTLSPSMLTKALETIERNATLQAKLVQDLLDISRIAAGKLRLKLEPFEIESVIESAIAAVLTAAIAKDIHLEWKPSSVQEASQITILGDRDRLQQVICNLLNNAIKFTPEKGQVEVKLSLVTSYSSLVETDRLQKTNDQRQMTKNKFAQITITDTGIGISADFLLHVFDRFRQAKSSESAKGLGLGLAIARHLVELHNGTIHAESAGEGQGTTFIVRLPVLKVASSK